MAYNPETGTDTIVFIPMKQTGTVSQPKTQSKAKQNNQPQTPAIQRTYRQKSKATKSPETTKKYKRSNISTQHNILILTLPSICAKTESVTEKDSVLKRRMQPMTSGQRRDAKQKLNQLFTSGNYDSIDEAHFETASYYTPRVRQLGKPVPHNILTLPEYQQSKKEIARFGAQMTPNKNNCWLPKDCVTQFDNTVKINGAEMFIELNFNTTR